MYHLIKETYHDDFRGIEKKVWMLHGNLKDAVIHFAIVYLGMK